MFESDQGEGTRIAANAIQSRLCGTSWACARRFDEEKLLLTKVLGYQSGESALSI